MESPTYPPSEIVAEGNLELLGAVAEYIVANAEVRVTQEPKGAMTMVRHVDPLEHTPFYLGEAHVTECEVDVDGALGYGCVFGDARERSLYAALIDAVVGSELAMREQVLTELASIGRTLKEERDRQWGRVTATRVDFDLK